ncbi:uncharacterized protein K452DRAFT_281500 [Aplosporella prunicola CBS 121167]|uniref:Heterokaryon incompatibility domain-containing protein n=1 Tax=Aplosporella prunicola CBS 121167 TaxID=1176127 RepID=A0A6A6AW92_9PEZI|nr:uncharacterized protein K452DRAFT_281500 [Aplosporella prunicola CBS 121167]KAF2135453.1 hypothetical protein K452DRAFT_281500 [Aplosporella prunicola CBS 121167]
MSEAFPAGPQKYNALSYTWGDGAKDKPIKCHGRTLLVTANLHRALRRFRDPDHVVTMWIDQLCIDQKNIKERNRQVSLMGAIYRAADRVIVWLGDDTQYFEDGTKLDLKCGLSLMRQILKKTQTDPELRFEWDSLGESRGLPSPGKQQWQALAAVLQRPWFSRVWVIQEAVLSADVEIFCGEATFSWNEVGQIVNYLDCEDYRNWNIRDSGLATELPFSRINRIKLQNAQSELPDLFDLMLACRDFGASDPRDKIYALLELSQHNITPDYSKSPADVFVNFAVYTIQAAHQPRTCCADEREKVHRAMTTLCCAGSFNQEQELPSWVPDWSYNPKVRPLCFWGSKDYKAGGDSTGEFHLRQDGRLQVSGKFHDTVNLAGTPSWILPSNYYTSTMGVAVGRVLVLTSSGYMGLAPYGTRDGDIIFIMLGCDIPLMLRPSGDEFTLLGECIVHGVMDGEAMCNEDIVVQDVTIK